MQTGLGGIYYVCIHIYIHTWTWSWEGLKVNLGGGNRKSGDEYNQNMYACKKFSWINKNIIARQTDRRQAGCLYPITSPLSAGILTTKPCVILASLSLAKVLLDPSGLETSAHIVPHIFNGNPGQCNHHAVCPGLH